MRNEAGITLITVVITIVLLTILAGIAVSTGIDIYGKAKVINFEANMKMIQKKVDIIIEEDVGYLILYPALTNEQKARLQTILNQDTNNYIETENAELSTLRYFSRADMETYFDIKDINDEIVINFANREVISLNGVEKDGVMHYVEYGLH